MPEALVPEFPKENILAKRLAHLVSVGAVPAGAVSLVGDLWGPKGGWVVVALMGAAALCLLVVALAYLTIREDTSRAPALYRWVTGSDELSWAWTSRPVVLSHGLHVLFVFGVICLFAAHKTYAEAAEGGFVAKRVDMAAAMQSQLGIMRAQLQEQKRTTAAVEDLNKTAATLKRETSDDARKELANLSLQWTTHDVERAVELSDLRAVRLYQQAGFVIRERVFVIASKALKTNSSEMEALVAKMAEPHAYELHDFDIRCDSVVSSAHLETSPSNEALALLKKVCSGPEQLKGLRADLASARKTRSSLQAGAPGADYWDSQVAKYERANKLLHFE